MPTILRLCRRATRAVKRDDARTCTAGRYRSHWSTWAPVYQFRTRDGQTIEVEDALSSHPPMFVENQVVDVLYDPAAPHDARAKRVLHHLPLILGGLGVLLLGVALGLLLLLRTIPHLSFAEGDRAISSARQPVIHAQCAAIQVGDI